MTGNQRQSGRYSILDTEEKRRMRQKISDILTPEVKNECPGLAILVVTIYEYEIMMEALKNESIRKRMNNPI